MKATKYRESTDKYIFCRKCGVKEIKVSKDAVSGICWLCLLKGCEPPVQLVKERKLAEREKRPPRQRGWQFMKEYVDEEGNVYYKGIEQPKLKDTLPPTPKKEPHKKSFTEKMLAEEKKRNKLVKRFEKAKKEKKKKKTNKFTNKPLRTRNKK